MYFKCDSCNGKGYLGSGTCPRCYGLGKGSTMPKPLTSKGKKGKGK